MQVRDVMSENLAYCLPSSRLEDVARLMVAHDCGAIPIVQDDHSKRPLGIVTDRDITTRAVAKGKNPLELTAQDCMTPDVATISADAPIEECCRIMEDRQIRRMLVVDDDRGCCGIVAQADVALHASPFETAEVVKEVSRA